MWWKRVWKPILPPAPRPQWNDYAAIEAQVFGMCAQTALFGRDDISRDTTFWEIDGSVGGLEIVMECEHVFAFEIPESEAHMLESVGQLVDYIARRLNIEVPPDDSSASGNA